MTSKRNWKQIKKHARTEAIQPLLEQGLSASQIAAHFENCSKNSIISHCRRYGIAMAMKPGKPKKIEPTQPRDVIFVKAETSMPKPIIDISATPDASAAVPFWTAVEQRLCQWPLWDDTVSIGDCCGLPRKENSPYCEAHTERSIARGHRSECEAVKERERQA